MEYHETQDQAMNQVTKSIDEAVARGKWMVAVWSVHDGRLELATRTTWQFPQGDYLGALGLLNNSMTQETEPPKPSPLPRAKLQLAGANNSPQEGDGD